MKTVIIAILLIFLFVICGIACKGWLNGVFVAVVLLVVAYGIARFTP